MADVLLPAIGKQPGRPASPAGALVIPAVIADADDHAARRFLEFFAAQIRNKNTRMAYYRAVCHFFAWVEQHRIGELAEIEPNSCRRLYRGAADVNPATPCAGRRMSCAAARRRY